MITAPPYIAEFGTEDDINALIDNFENEREEAEDEAEAFLELEHDDCSDNLCER